MANVYREVEDMIKFMGGTHQVLINWHWCNNLASEELANGFVKWLEERGFEHRGTYFKDDLWSVRYRHTDTLKKDDELIAKILGDLEKDPEEIEIKYGNFAKRIPYSGFYLIFDEDTDEIMGGINFFPHPDSPGYISVVFYANDLQEAYDAGYSTTEKELEERSGTDDCKQAVDLWNTWNHYEL